MNNNKKAYNWEIVSILGRQAAISIIYTANRRKLSPPIVTLVYI